MNLRVQLNVCYDMQQSGHLDELPTLREERNLIQK